MTKVYIIVSVIKYEADQIEFLYQSESKAKEQCKKLNQNSDKYRSYEMDEWEVEDGN